jgi:predicted nucleic acid-binding protein
VIHFDTSFVVDFLRETSRDDPGPATALLDSLPLPEDLAVSVFVLCELLAGAALAQQGDEERQKVCPGTELNRRHPFIAITPES